MRIAIMQPYLFPYIGYFQLINAVDKFVIYDNIEFTKKGWINRNRILVNGKDDYFTLPLKKDSDFLQVNQRVLSENISKDTTAIINKLSELYRKAPQYKTVFPILENVFKNKEQNLFEFILFSLKAVNDYIEIPTEIVVSSTIDIDHNLKSEAKVIAICKELHATQYINAIGGTDLYSKAAFEAHNLQLNFIKSDPVEYRQFDNDFLPWLSIIDVMMFNSKEEIKTFLSNVTFQ